MSRTARAGAAGRAMTATAVAFVLGLAAGMVGCPKQALVQDTVWVEEHAGQGELAKTLTGALDAYAGGDHEEALSLLDAASAMGPDDGVKDFIALHRGMAFLRLGEPGQAHEALAKAAKAHDKAIATSARLLDGLALEEMGDAEKASQILDAAAPGDMAAACEDKVLVERLLDAAAGLALASGDIARACSIHGLQTADLGASEQDLAAAGELLEGIDSALAGIAAGGALVPDTATLLGAVSTHGPFWALLARRAALDAVHAWDLDRAEDLAAQLSEQGFGALAGPVKVAILGAREELAGTDPMTIGALLPLTGKASAVGKIMKKGIETALRILKAENQFEVIYLDTGDDPGITRDHVRALRHEHKAIAAVGPASGATVMAAAEEAAAVGLPLVTLSPRPGLTQVGELVLRNFSTNEAEADMLAAWAVGTAGLRTVAVLYPDTAYGKSMAELFVARVEEKGGEIALVASFAAGETNFLDLAKKVHASPGIQAVFLPVTSQKLGLIAPALACEDVWPAPLADLAKKDGKHRVVLLAPQVAHSADLPVKAGKYLQGTVMCTGFHPGDQDPFTMFFIEEYERDHQAPPNVQAAYAADALLVVGQGVVAGGARTRGELVAWLIDPKRCGAWLFTVGSFGGFLPGGEPAAPLTLVTIEGKGFAAFEAQVPPP